MTHKEISELGMAASKARREAKKDLGDILTFQTFQVCADSNICLQQTIPGIGQEKIDLMPDEAIALRDWLIGLFPLPSSPSERSELMEAACKGLVAWAEYGGDSVGALNDAVATAQKAMDMAE